MGTFLLCSDVNRCKVVTLWSLHTTLECTKTARRSHPGNLFLNILKESSSNIFLIRFSLSLYNSNYF